MLVEVLRELGGVCTRAQLLELITTQQLASALREGALIRLQRGRYCLPEVGEALQTAHRLGVPLSHRSAAVEHGWAVKTVPRRPDVLAPRNRHLPEVDATVHRGVLGPDDVVGSVTSTDRTLVDCLRSLPADESLAIADSALRSGVSPAHVVALARDLRGPGARQARRVAALADPRAANPFESVLRWIALGVPGLHVVPQRQITLLDRVVRPDLVDEELRLVLEADSFEWHGNRAALRRDCRRYDDLVRAGWTVLRFAYEDVMGDAAWVEGVLVEVTAMRTKRVA